jgi:uncharacterized protein (TIGR00251 family)
MDQPAWEATSDGIVVPVQAQPKSRRNAIIGVRQGQLLVAVTAPPEDGKANDALLAVLADGLRVKRRQISLISGLTSRRKRFLISEANLQQLEARVAELPD